MPIDPLTAQLLVGGGEGNAAMFGLDPNVAAAMPEIQLAQGMEQQGISTAPAYPGQALARALQGGVGALLQKGAITDLGRAYSNSLPALQHIFPQGTPIGDALASGNPIAIQMALQAAPTAMKINSQGYNLEPGGTHFVGANPVAASGAPQSPEGKLVSDAEVLARRNPAAADALTSAVSKAGQIGETGVAAPPIPLRAPPNVTPSAAVPPPEPHQETTPPKNPDFATPPAAAKDQGQVPEAVGPAKAPALPDTIAQAKAMQEEAEKLHGGAAGALSEQIGDYIKGGPQARTRIQTLDTIDDALKSGNSNIVTGPMADRVLRGKELLDGLGIDTSWVKAGLPMTEMISKMNAQLASASARQMTGRPTQFEFAAWMKNNPGLLTSKEGTHALIDVLRQMSQQDVNLSQLASDKKNWDNWGNVVQQYYADPKHGLKSPFTGNPMAADNARSASGGIPPPAIGFLKNGYRFKGGDPAQQASWEKQ